MAFLLRVLSGKRLETREDVVQLREEFYGRKEKIFHELLQNAEVQSFVEMIYDGTHRQTQYFLRSPSQYWLKENPQLVSETVSVLSSLTELSILKRLKDAIENYGVDPVSDIILELFRQLPFARHIGISDSFLDELKYGWQLGSPLSGNLRSNRRQKQQIRSAVDETALYTRECDEADKLDHCMDGDLPVSTSPRHDNDGVNWCDFGEQIPGSQAEGSGSDTQVVVEKDSVGEQEKESADQTMRVTPCLDPGVGQAASESVSNSTRADLRTPSAISSRGHSGRHSVASEIYTTDSDDDSFSTSSHRSLLVAVSEAHEGSSSSSSSSSSGGDDSASESDKNEIGTLRGVYRDPENSCPCHDCPETKPENSGNDESVHDFHAFKPDIQHEPDEFLEDKLPICSSVVLSSKSSVSENELSFYTPEMWTYSEKEAMEMEAGNASGRNIPACIDQEKILEEVKVVIAPSVEDKYVSVSVQPVTADLWEKAKAVQVQDGFFVGKELRTSDLEVEPEVTYDKKQVHGNLAEEKPSSDLPEKTKSEGIENLDDIPPSGIEKKLHPIDPGEKTKSEESGKSDDLPVEEKLPTSDSDEKTKSEETVKPDDIPSSEIADPVEKTKEETTNSDDMPPSESSEKHKEDEEKVAADKNLVVADRNRYPHDKQVYNSHEIVDAADESQVAETKNTTFDDKESEDVKSQVVEPKISTRNVEENGNAELEVVEPKISSSRDDEENGNAEPEVVEPNISTRNDEENGNAESQIVEPKIGSTSDDEENENAEPEVVEPRISTRDDEENGNAESQIVEPKINTRDASQVVEPKVNTRDDEENGSGELQVVGPKIGETGQVIGTEKLSAPAENSVEISEAQAEKKSPQSLTVKGGELSTQKCESSAKKPKDEDAIGLERSSPKASDSPPKLEPLVIPCSGLLPLSGPISYSPHSGTVPYSGSLSLRSDSSTNSTRSFAFPILSGECNSSPVKMAPPDRSFAYHRRRSWRSLCCFCSTDSTTRYG